MFNEIYAQTFQLFSIMHIIPVGIIFIIITLIYIKRDWLRDSNKETILRYSLAALIVLQEITLQVYRLVFNTWELSTSLPLQLCAIGVMMTAVILITKSKTLFLKTVFILFIGASLALITPGIENNYGFPHFRYYQFFVSHGLIVINLSVILFVFNFQKDIRYKHLLDNFVSLMLIAIILYIINIITGGNYMYLMEKPAPGTLFDAFGPYPIYIVQILCFGIPFFFHLFYIPFFIRDFRMSNTRQNA
ncbi:MAG: TIGR02206 family membrane protein [Candidatus Izemoplasma sp.]|nr:TIGR02206 family membrane protein [Candidatus Izemoplasma sp.]